VPSGADVATYRLEDELAIWRWMEAAFKPK